MQKHRSGLASSARDADAGVLFDTNWSLGGDQIGSITLAAQQDGVRLLYHMKDANGARVEVNELVTFAYTPTRFGGQRQWFRTCGEARQRRNTSFRQNRLACGGQHINASSSSMIACRAGGVSPSWRSSAGASRDGGVEVLSTPDYL